MRVKRLACNPKSSVFIVIPPLEFLKFQAYMFYQLLIVSKNGFMASKDTVKLTLIFICIALHCFNGVGIFYSHPFSVKSMTFNEGDIDFIALRNKLSFLMRIAGGYSLGYLANKIGFFKTMKIICLINITSSLLLFIFESSNIFENAIFICLSHGVLKFMSWSSLILPVIYIFQHYEEKEAYKYSAIALSMVVFGMLITNMFSIIYKSIDHFNIFIVYVSSGLLSLIIYGYLDAMSKVKIKKIKENPISKEAICLAFLLAGVCGVCLSYQYYFVENYFNTVMIVKTAGGNIVYSPFWITLFLTLLPAAKMTKDFDFVKIFRMSLAGILISVSLFYIIPVYNKPILFIHQVIYAISFGVFLAPALRSIYQLLQGSHSYFRMNFIFGFGFSTFVMISDLMAQTRILPAPFLGLILIITLMSLCLWIIYHFGFFKKMQSINPD